LQKHLEQGPRASLLPAVGLGRRAVALGLETLDLARIHEQAVTALELASKKDGYIKRARIFFTEVITRSRKLIWRHGRPGLIWIN